MYDYTMRNPHGYVVVTDPDVDKPKEEYDTFQCVHCGAHVRIVSGSGKIRGFCTHCHGPICGPRCANCVPFQEWLKRIEAIG